jgi:hypothetical protein
VGGNYQVAFASPHGEFRPLENTQSMIGIDISPAACRVMAKHLRDVCGLP